MKATRAGVLIGCALFAGIMCVLHVVRQDLSPLVRGMSRYAGSATLVVATVAFLALAGATAALASLLDRGLAIRFVLVAAAGLVVVAATPIGDHPTAAAVTVLHTIGGLAFYLGAVGAMFLSASGTRERLLAWISALALGLFFAAALGVPGIRVVTGLLQRAVFTFIIAWMVKRAVR